MAKVKISVASHQVHEKISQKIIIYLSVYIGWLLDSIRV